MSEHFGAQKYVDLAESPARPGALALIGDTPLVELSAVNPNPNVTLYAKLEKNNPGGSVKDRVGLFMIEAAEASGELTPGKTIIEPTSGKLVWQSDAMGSSPGTLCVWEGMVCGNGVRERGEQCAFHQVLA